MKKILIIGASGKVGKLLSEKLKDSPDFTPIALFRKEEQKDYFEKKGIDYRIVSIEEDMDQLVEAMSAIDAIVFAAGSGGNTGDDKTLTVDLDGAVKSMDAAEKAGVKRFVMLSALKADERKFWDMSGIKPYYVAKYYADRILRSSGLDFTIVRPGLLLDKKGTGKITIENPISRKGVPREDVAETLVEVLRQNSSIGSTIEFNEGESPIKDAVGDS